MENNEPTVEPIHYEATLPARIGLAGHNWVQRGPMLICQSCPYEHSQHVPPHLIYRGLDQNGHPILETVK